MSSSPSQLFPATSEFAAGEAASSLVSATLAALETARRQSHDAAAQAAMQQAVQALELLERNAETNATRYRSLIDAVPDAVTLLDEDGHILDANAPAAEIYGYGLEQLRRMTVYELNPDLPAQHMREVMRTFQLGRTVTVETSNRRGDGTRFPVEVHSNLYIDGEQRRIVAVARDITRRHEADVELRASEARYRALLQAMDKGVLVQDGHGLIVSVNPAGCRLLGLTEAEMLTARRENLQDWRFEDETGTTLPFEQLPGMRALLTGKAVENALIGVYLPHLRVYRWISIGAVPQFLPGSARPFQVISTFSDVTALRRSSEMFAKTQALASIGGWEIDFHGVLFWTEEMYRIHDLPPHGTITYERARGFYAAADLVRLDEAARLARDHGDSFELEMRLTSAIGRRRWVRMLGQPLRRQGMIVGLSGTTQDITERKLHEEQLKRQARTDALTGLANRDTMLAAVDDAIAAAGGMWGPALLFVDLDRFKIVNDMLGHAAGDRILAVVAERLAQCAGAEATAARFGADEFLLLLPEGENEARVQQLAERVTAAFTQPFAYAGEEFALTVSVGIARFPIDGATAQQLVNHADAAMVEAKRRGRNTWQAFTPQLARNLSDRLLIESQLRRALDNGEFRLEYQPTIDLANHRVIGAEALLRWYNHQLGELGPALFIGHAENSGDIVRIGAWVIRETCRQLRAWRDAGLELRRVSVNVSYRQFLSEQLAETVLRALREFDLPGEALELEMTERVLIEDVPDTLATLATLRGLGVTLTIDDFGEGYSALNYLRRLPIDGIKISHSFMQGIPGNTTDTAICVALVRMAQSLGLAVTAEGVEHAVQRDFLLELGTPLAQGFLFSRSLAPDTFAAFCENWNRPEKVGRG